MRTILSDSGQYILVFNGDSDEPEEMTKDEFVAAYGEDALPIPTKRKYQDIDIRAFDTMHYYAKFREFVEWCGKYSWAKKLKENAEDGVSEAQRVMRSTFGDGADIKLQSEISRRKASMERAVREVDFWSQRVGYLPMSEKDKEFLMRVLMARETRRKLYYRIDRNQKQGKLQSAKELLMEIAKSYRKKLS